MSVSIDKEPADGGDVRRVLASWLDDYAGGRCDRADMQESFLSVCRSNPDAPWDALALLDQYQRRGRIDAELARTLKTDIAQLVFGERQPDRRAAARSDRGDARHDRLALAQAPRRERVVADQRMSSRRSSIPRCSAAISIRRRVRRTPEVRAGGAGRAQDAVEAATREGQCGRRTSCAIATSCSSILGRGSSGTVYRALDRHRAHLADTARYVAVKVLKLDYQNRPERARGAGARVPSGAVVVASEHRQRVRSRSRRRHVLHRDGAARRRAARRRLRRLGGPMQREHALAIISSVGAALAHAHRRDIVHADLKPRNIMITSTGEVRVLDFGFARHRPLDLHSASAFDAAPASAPAYASVERVNGSEPHPSDDVYSLACIAYELLSGEHPFGGRSAVLARAHGRRPRNIPGLTRKQMQTLQRALLWTRGERKIDVVDLLAGLGCAEAPERLVPPEALVAHDATRPAGDRRALGLLVFAADGRCGSRCVHLSRAQPACRRVPQLASRAHRSHAEVREPAAAAGDGTQAAADKRSRQAAAKPAKAQPKARRSRRAPPARSPPQQRRPRPDTASPARAGRAGVRQGHLRRDRERWFGAHRGRAPRLDAASR